MIGDLIGEWIKGILIDGIMGNLSGLFNTVNTKVGEIASDVGSTPQDWNGGIFSMLAYIILFIAVFFICIHIQKNAKLISADSADNRIPTEILSHILRQFLQGKISRSMTVYIIDEFKIVDIHLYRHA